MVFFFLTLFAIEQVIDLPGGRLGACGAGNYYDPAHAICQPFYTDESPYYIPPAGTPYNPGPILGDWS